MTYSIGDYVQVKINGSKVWRYIRQIDFLNPDELEYRVSYEMSCRPKTWVRVGENQIICKQLTI